MSQPTVKFTKEQLDALIREFPTQTMNHTATEAALRHYHGQQSVLHFVARHTHGHPKSGPLSMQGFSPIS